MFDPNNPFRKGDSLVDAVRSILSGKPIEEKKMDPVDQKALKGKHSDRKDKDIDNDGDVDDSDEYLHKRRQAISKAMKESEDEMDDEDDDEEEENGKKKKLSGKKDEVDTKPSMDDQKMASEMSDAQMKKREEIVKSMKKKMPDFKKKYGERAKDVMYATATKMAMKEGFELTEEDFEELDEAKMSASQIAALKKAYEPMRGKKISMDSGNKLRSIMDKVNDDKQALIQLVKADIPFVSSLAVTRLISKHGMKGAEINKLKEEVELDEAKFSAKEIKMAIGIASDPRYKGGKMTGAAQAIDKIKPGLSDHPQVRAVLQRVNEAPEDMEPASPDEGSMAVQQLEFMMHAIQKMKMHIQSGGEFPEWMQNKLSGTHEKLKSLYANIEHGDMNEELDLDEMKMDDPKLVKAFDKMKKGDTIKLKTSSTISQGKDFVDYVVKSKNVVNKGRVEKITLVTKGNEKAVKKFLYKRDGKVTFAIGDMGASIDDIKEGTWALPDSPKAKAELKKLMSKPIKLGKEGDEASDKLYALIGDDELFDDLYVAGKKNPNGDARPVISKWMKKNFTGSWSKYAIEEVELDETTYSYKAATFNGNVVKGTGSTKEAARKDAEKKAKALGSTIRKRLPEEVDLEGK